MYTCASSTARNERNSSNTEANEHGHEGREIRSKALLTKTNRS